MSASWRRRPAPVSVVLLGAGFVGLQVVGVTVLAALSRLGRRSGVSDRELAMALPGDDLVAAPTLVCDRAATLPAEARDVWPWVLQLGKDRAGWYLPSPVSLLVPVARRGSPVVEPAYQRLAVGDVVPDWGPLPFRVAKIDAAHHLVYVAERSPEAGRPLRLSWALVLHPHDDGTRLHLRLRVQSSTRFARVAQAVGGTFDHVTVALLFAGLRQRLSTPRGTRTR